MIAVRKSADWKDVLRQSAVANAPGAEDVLRGCLFMSREVRYGEVDGRVVCMWGLIPPTILSTTAYIWLLTTKQVEQHKFLFIRYSQRYVEEALKRYDALVGDAVVGNDAAIRWLRWLGAEFKEPIGARIPFVIRRKRG